MRKANNFHKLEFSMKMSYFCTHFDSLCCYNPFITIFTVVITYRGNFILYLMPYTLRHRMTNPTKWPVHPPKSQISLGIRPVWSASSLCEGPNIYWRGQRRLWSDWEYDKTNKMTCAPSEVSDQPGHPPSLCVKDQTFIDVDSEDSDQTDSMTKPTKWPVRPTKPQFCMAIRPFWSRLRCVKDQTFIDVGSEDSEHDKTNKITCAPSEVSNQSGHPPSLISIFAVWRTKHLLMRTV